MTPKKLQEAQEYLQNLLKGFCIQQVSIETSEYANGVIFDLRPSRSDSSFVVGRRGIIIFSIRNLMALYWQKKRDESDKEKLAILVNGEGFRFYEKPEMIKQGATV